MLKIRLMRIGGKNNPKYRIIVVEGKSKRNGSYIETVGFYDPQLIKNSISLKKERISYWLSRGAQYSSGLTRLL